MVEKSENARGVGDFPFPFYGGWPPERLYGDKQPVTIKGALPHWAILAILALVGIAAVILGRVIGGTFFEILGDLGGAVLVAAFLGLTIDRWFKAELAKDVFTAVLGRMFPEEFREEIRAIVGNERLCDRHLMTVEIVAFDADCVKMNVTSERSIRNITTRRQSAQAHLHIDDWGFAQGKSEIHECYMVLPDGQRVDAREVPTNRSRLLFESETREIGPDEVVRHYSKYTEIRRVNDFDVFHFMTPTREPEIQVKVPAGYDYDWGFGASGPVDKAVYQDRHTLKGTYFPTQSMRVRWWPKAKAIN